MTEEKSDNGMVTLRKSQIWVAIVTGIVVGIIVPIITVQSAYNQAKADIQNQIYGIQIKNVETFAKTTDVKDINVKIDKLTENVAELKGLMYQQKPVVAK